MNIEKNDLNVHNVSDKVVLKVGIDINKDIREGILNCSEVVLKDVNNVVDKRN